MNDSDDISIEELFKVLDSAFTSNNPAVKKALKNFLMIAAIVHSEDSNPIEGPLQKLLKKIQDLEIKVRTLDSVTTYRGTTYPTPARERWNDVNTWYGTPLGQYIVNSVSTSSSTTSTNSANLATSVAKLSELESYKDLELTMEKLSSQIYTDAK